MPEGAPSAPMAPLVGMLEDITVTIEDAVREKPRRPIDQAPPGSYVLSLRVKVTSTRLEKAYPLVEAKRFYLELENGEKAPVHSRGTRQPTMSTLYLKKGDSTWGWLAFQVPEKSKQLTLKTGLTRKATPVPAIREAEDG